MTTGSRASQPRKPSTPRRRRTGLARRGTALAVPTAVLLSMVVACSTPASTAAPAADPTPSHATHSPAPSAPTAAGTDQTSEPEAPEAAEATTVALSVTDTAFSPSTLTVAAGDTIIVTNTGQLEHSWTSDEAGFDAGVLAPGESATITVTNPGTFAFYCMVHPTMTGTLVVS